MAPIDRVAIKKTSCALCPAACGVEVHVVGGKVTKVQGDRESPIGRGKVCPKVAGAVDLHYHKDRLNYPLKRIGKRGESHWQRISWTEAIGEIAEKLASIRDRFGPEALVYLGGTYRPPGDWAAWRFCNLFGSPNIFGQGKNCGQAEFVAEWAVYGRETIGNMPVPGLTKCVVLWGVNLPESRHLWWQPMLKAKKAGVKFIVVDPRYTETAAEADIWLQLRPSTDGALALGMLHVIVEEELYDKAFVEQWCLGFDEIRRCVADYPLEKVAKITNVPAEKIAEAARLYAKDKPSILSFGVAACHLGSGAAKSAVLGKSLLRAITGNLDIPGGHVFNEGLKELRWPQELYWDYLVSHPLRKHDNVSADEFPAASVKSYALFREAMSKIYPHGCMASQYMRWVSPTLLWPAILEGKPYPIRAVITQSGNPLVTLAGSRAMRDALVDDKLELHVGMDLFMSPTIQLADYVLPAADFMERPDIRLRWGLADEWVCGEQTVAPLYERRDDYQLWRDLGVRLGQEGYWPDMLEGMLDRFLEPTGQTFGDFVARKDFYQMRPPRPGKYKEQGFATFSGKVELVPSILAKLGYDPLPTYEEPPQSPYRTKDLAKEYPLILISGSRVRWFTHSTLRQIPRLRRKHPDPILEINPDTAGKLGITDGDWVFVETTVGRVKQKARLTAGISPEVVHADGYWWFPEKPAEEPTLFGVWESNINSIIPDAPEICDYAGDHFFRGPLCRVYKAS
ncbi:MAG: molybdopterin oxidoreductase [Chloroflexota bacterium]|nr:MAG: molybdopterin oxidoreductase [Chloroflexota bacterium]